MDYRTLVNKLEAIQRGTVLEAAAIANPYKDPAQAAKFNAMSDADQEWLTRGGGVPDINDEYILMRAPNKGQPDPAKAAAATTAAAQTAADDSGLADAKAKLEKLNALIAALKPAGGQAAAPAGATTAPAKPTTNKKPQAKPQTVGSLPMKQQAAIAAGTDPALVNDQGMAFGGGGLGEGSSNMANQLIESFGYQNQTDEGIAGTVAGRAAKLLPGVGLAYGAYDAYDRAKEGDWTGAAMAGASGIASLVPGVGTAVSAGLDAANLARDYKAGKFSGDTAVAKKDAAPATTVPAGGDPKVFALQQELIKKGAKIAADGKMGPKTQMAMQQFKVAAPTVAENMASLRERLAMIEAEQAQATDEGAISNAWNAAKSIGKNVVGGVKGWNVQGQQAAAGAVNAAGKKIGGQTLAATGAERAANAAGKTINKGVQAVKANPIKSALGGAVVGGGLGLAAGGSTAVADAGGTGGAGGTGSTGGAGGTSAAPTGSTTATPAQAAGQNPAMDEINQLLSDLSQYNIPEIQQGLVASRAALSKAIGDPAIGSADTAAKNASGVDGVVNGSEQDAKLAAQTAGM
jgi:hypothetical protein